MTFESLRAVNRGAHERGFILSVLLCRRKAQHPFRHDKLNINLWSEQELCYVIYNYPLLCLGSFLSETLFSWIERELQMKDLAEKLRKSRKDGESVENQLLMILQDCDYYDVSEVRDFGGRIQELKRKPPFELACMEGMILYRSDKLQMAYDKMEEAVRLLDQDFRQTQDDSGMDALLHRKADIFCDMAAIRLRMFDTGRALELLASSEMCCANRRAGQMRYLINGTGDISDREKQELDEAKEAAVERARKSQAYRDVEMLFEKDSVRIFREAGEIVRNWKRTYRAML